MTFPFPFIPATATGYVTTAVVFDGTNDGLSRGADFTGMADSKSGIFSSWFRINGGDGAQLRVWHAAGGDIIINRNASNKFEFSMYSTGAVQSLLMLSTTSYTAGATWRHILASWDLAATVGHFYVTDVDDKAAGGTYLNNTLNYTNTNHYILQDNGSASRMNADVADFYLAPGQYLDFSSSANRRKFISSTGKPVDLGVDGSTPTGVAPILFLKGDATTFPTNLGTGGGMTLAGALTNSVGSPSD
jgi:hypothetical protein